MAGIFSRSCKRNRAGNSALKKFAKKNFTEVIREKVLRKKIHEKIFTRKFTKKIHERKFTKKIYERTDKICQGNSRRKNPREKIIRAKILPGYMFLYARAPQDAPQNFDGG